MKFLFEYLTDSFSLLDNPIDDYVIMAVIGVIAYIRTNQQERSR